MAPKATQLSTRTPTKTGLHGAAVRHAKRAASAALPDLRQLEQVFSNHEWSERRAYLAARRRSRERAQEILVAGHGPDATRTALLAATSELLVGFQLQGGASTTDAVQLLEQIESVTGISAIAIAREALRAPELLAAPASAAIDASLALLLAAAPLRSVSLWKLDLSEHAACLSHAGGGEPTRRARQLAQRILLGEEDPAEAGPRSLIVGLPVGRPRQRLGALVGYARQGMRESVHPFLAAAVPTLGSVLERELLTASNVASERALVESSERKLTRLGFDLHDGPVQDVAVLAQDVRLFREQLERMIGPLTEHERVRGRIEDLEGQLHALDADLRRLSIEVQAASVLLNRPFERALRDRTQAFTVRTGIQPRVKLRGDIALVSGSQQIALLNIIQESLNNIREHANATRVEIRLSADERGVDAQVIDNGAGFDLEETLIRAAREGRVGLIAMNERVRLLGGQCRIESRQGGPTLVSVTLERWRPTLTAGDAPAARTPQA